MRVADILKKKGSSVVTLPSTATVSQLLATLADHKIGAVVAPAEDRVVGVASERDVVHHLRAGRDQSSALSDLMSVDVQSATAHDDLDQLAVTMTEQRIRHLPVIEDGALKGIVSIGDVVKAIMSDQELVIEQLEKYINGQR